VRKIEKHAIAVNSASGLRSVPNPKKTAHALQAMGTHGDDILAHINAKEATLLDMLADGRLDGGGTNKRTGLKAFGNTDGESGRSGGDANPGGVGGGPTGGQTGGGLGGNTAGGLGGLSGGYGGAGEGDRGAPSSGENVTGNPEMGGGLSRSIGLRSVEALGLPGSPMRNVNAASAVMAGRTPSFGDKMSDFVGSGAPGGFAGSRAANMGATIAGGLIGGPWGAAAANVAHNAVLGGRSLADTVPGTVGGMIAGGLGSMAAQAVADGIRGKESYEPTMSQADRDAKDKAGIENARSGTTGAPAQSDPGTSDGAGAGTAYVMAAPETAAPTPATASAPASSVKDNWDEAGFLSRNPEVGKAVKDGIWTSGRSFNTAYKAQAGANYDSAKALGLVSPYTNDMLAARPGVAVAYRG
jgi:hypothetical protein